MLICVPSQVLDGDDDHSIFNALQNTVTFKNVAFVRGKGNSGAGAYGERDMTFIDCEFSDNSADIHGGAVMAGKLATFTNVVFRDNSAKFAGAVRISDLGSGKFTNCTFIGNYAENRGGAVATQIETPEKQFVSFVDTTFCFNESPMVCQRT